MLLCLALYFCVMFSNIVNETKMDHKVLQTRDFSQIQKNKAWIYGLILLIPLMEINHLLNISLMHYLMYSD